MKFRSTPILSSLIVLAMAGGIEGARADDEYVLQQEELLRMYSEDKDPQARYADQLYQLASLYQLNGMRQKADRAFQEYLQLWRQKSHRESESSFMLEWAQWLVREKPEKPRLKPEERKADLLKASEITDEALAKSGKIDPTSEEKFKILFSAAAIYKTSGDSAKRQRVLAELDRTLQSMEKEKNPSVDRVLFVAGTLIQVADLYCPMPRWRQAINQKPIPLLSNEAPRSSTGVRAHEFEIADAYRMRALAQLDKLNTDLDYKIEVQRKLVAWYHLYGQTTQYNTQLRRLGCLLGSTDRKVLFPPQTRCPGCGRG